MDIEVKKLTQLLADRKVAIIPAGSTNTTGVMLWYSADAGKFYGLSGNYHAARRSRRSISPLRLDLCPGPGTLGCQTRYAAAPRQAPSLVRMSCPGPAHPQPPVAGHSYLRTD
jgi:hypothetical protein